MFEAYLFFLEVVYSVECVKKRNIEHVAGRTDLYVSLGAPHAAVYTLGHSWSVRAGPSGPVRPHRPGPSAPVRTVRTRPHRPSAPGQSVHTLT